VTPDEKRPWLGLLTSHWLSLLGVGMTTTAGFSWLFVLPMHLRGKADNPYIGILAFLIIPAILVLGLLLIPIGVVLARRQVVRGLRALPNRRASLGRLVTFLGLMTFVNLVIGSQATYRAVQHMETDQFCGQSCHVMKPEFTAWKQTPHAAHSHVECVECHIGPGAAGWFQAKTAGIQQLKDVTFDTTRKPIESGLESNRLVRSSETCERCHARERDLGSSVKIRSSFREDEANTRTETVMTVREGDIHRAHVGPGVKIRYAPADAKRQTIQWVEYFDGKGRTTTYPAAGVDAKAIAALPKYEMQCVDCHNRAAHSFQAPAKAVDSALESGEVPAILPFVRKTGLEIVTAEYPTAEAAAKGIPEKLLAFYQAKYPELTRTRAAEIEKAGKGLVAVYNRNVFPDLKVAWGTYPMNLGHTDAPGCFRCHDGSHSSADNRTITNDCSTCHEAVAVDEASPEVLKTLGIAEKKPTR
jgi:nitrate/TMAO reductase-like tetraheme cytochrome c subunit